MGSPAYWGQLVNFQATSRKRNLIPFGLFSPNDNLGFIASENNFGYSVEAPTGIVGTAGTTFTFSFPPSEVVYNGLSLFPPNDFTLVGNVVTMPASVEVGAKLYGVS